MSAYGDIGLPLHKASRDGDHEKLHSLLLSGQYDVNAGSYDLIRPLHEACSHGHLECVRILLDFGAQVNVHNIDGATPLCDASCKGSVEVVKLLLKHGAHVNLPLTQHTPIHEAVLNNRWECVEILLNHKANPNVNDCFYGTPLHIAAARGHKECAEVLLRHGANVNATYIHATPLHRSSYRLDEGMTRLLLEHGADVYKEDNRGCTARSLLPEFGEAAMVMRNLLLSWEKTPKSLSHYCRLSIRKTMGKRGLYPLYSSSLPVPQCVTNFLLYSPHKQQIMQQC